MKTIWTCFQRPTRARLCWIALAAAAATPVACWAQTDEIQVYDAVIVDKGQVGLELHNNFTPKGLKTPAFPGGLQSDKAFVGVAEWAFGVTDWFEAGLYLPLYSHTQNQGGTYNGFKLRSLFVKPHAEDHTFFYGLNFEFSVNSKQWDERRYTSEIRPIVGWHLKPPAESNRKTIDLIVNPILDTSYTGGLKSLDFAPGGRAAYHLTDKWTAAAEEYADYGPLRRVYGARDQSHQVYAVLDHDSKFAEVEFGVGFGLTSASDKVTLKLMLSRPLN